MGFLGAGAPLSWEATARYRDVVKRRGVRQYLQLHKQFSADVFPTSTLSWGDEVEYCLLNLDAENKVARLYLGAEGVLRELKTREDIVAGECLSHRSSDCSLDALVEPGEEPPSPAAVSDEPSQGSTCPETSWPATGNPAIMAPFSEAPSSAAEDSREPDAAPAGTAAIRARLPWQTSSWHPEYGTHMIEAIPGTVYPLRVDSILDLLPSMQVRRKKVQAVLPPGCYVASLGSFPTMGAPEYRRRPQCYCLCSSPSCCRSRALGREDTPARGSVAGADGAPEPAAREDSRLVQTREASYAGLSGAIHRCSGAGVSATADAGALANSGAAPGPGFLTERTAEKTQETVTLPVRATTLLLPHISPEEKASSPSGKFASFNEVVFQRDLLANAKGKSPIVTEQNDQDATYKGRKTEIGPEKQASQGGEAAEDGEQAAKDGHSLQATHVLPTDEREGRTTAAAVVAPKLHTSFLTLVGVTARTGNFAYPPAAPDPTRSLSRSLFVGDALINPHPRFGTLTANIRERRGRKAEILIPLFVDERTALTLPPVHRNIAGNTETHIPATTLTAQEHYPKNLFAADNVGLANGRVAGGAEVAEAGEGGAGRVKAGEADAKATAAGARVTTAVGGSDLGRKDLRVADGASKDCFATFADETRLVEEIYRQLMLEGKIIHDGKYIYMDAMGFGMGMHCVQGTFGCPSMRDARYLYDQLAVLAPLWLSLSAATPFMRGLLAAVDSRWDVIAACVDCRTDAEKYYLPKSRYGSASLYIGDEAPLTQYLSFYNDVPAPVNDRAFSALVENGVDEILAKHLAFLFVRDPLVIFKDKLFAQTFTKIRKSSRAETGAPSCPLPNTDRGGPAAACPAACATATHTSPDTAVLPTVSAVTVESPGTMNGGSTMSVLPRPSKTLKAAAYAAASNPRLPLQQQQVAQQVLHLEHGERKEEEEECDAVVMAEAATPWGIDDGTVYTTTEDFENLQSTNWNSVRFKPPTAFKPTAAPGTPQGLAEICKREKNTSLSGSASDRSRKNRNSGRGSTVRRWSSGSNVGGRRRRCISKDSEEAGFSSAVDSGRDAEERRGTDKSKEAVAKYESSRGNSVGIISATNPCDIVDFASRGQCAERNRRLTVTAAGDSGEVRIRTASAFGKVERRPPSACAGKLKAQVEEEVSLFAASFHKPELPTPTNISCPSSSFASSLASFPSSSHRPSAAVAADDCCAAPWRVEFRTPDVQLTDFENAACLSLVSVLVQVILEKRLDFYLPMSLNDENTRRAVECNSILRQKFWFRNDVRHGTTDRSFAEFTLHQILFGISSPRVSDAFYMHTQTDYSSSTRLSSTSSCRSPFLSSAFCSVCPSSTSSPFVYPPFLSPLSYTSSNPPTPSCSSSSYCIHTVSPLVSQQHSAPPSPFSDPAVRFPRLPSSPHAPLGVPPHHSSRLPHTHGAGDCGGVSNSAFLSSVAHCASPWSAASAPAGLCVCASGAGTSAASFPSVAESCSVEASSSVASFVSSGTSPPSLPSSISPFIGLVPLSLRYIEKQVVEGRCSREAAAQYLEYFDYLRHRTEGLLPTDASFLRACLAVHPAYNQDSIISASSCFDVCRLAVKVGLGEVQVPELFGPFAGRTGMRVSAESCCFDNGTPVVTSFFLSHFVSDALKEELRGYFSEASGGCWKQEREQLCACQRWGESAPPTRGGNVARREGQQKQQKKTVSATAAADEKKAAQTERDVIAAPRLHVENIQVMDQPAGLTYDKEKGVQGEAALNRMSRDGDAAIEGSEGLEKAIATIQRGHTQADQRLTKEGSVGDPPLPPEAASRDQCPTGRKERTRRLQAGEEIRRQRETIESPVLTTKAEESTSCRQLYAEPLGRRPRMLFKESTNSSSSIPATVQADRTAVWSKREEEEVLLTGARAGMTKFVVRRQAAVICSKPSTIGNFETISGDPATGSSHQRCSVIKGAGPHEKEPENQQSLTTVACKVASPQDAWDGKVYKCRESANRNNCIEKTGNSRSAPDLGKRREILFNDEDAKIGRNESKKDYEEYQNERERAAREQTLSDCWASTVCRRGDGTTEKSLGNALQLDIGAFNVPKENHGVDSLNVWTRFALAAKREEVAEGSAAETVATPDSASAPGRLQEAECKPSATTACRTIPRLTAASRTFLGEAGGSCDQLFLREEKADPRITVALSGKAAASLCKVDAASRLRRYMLEPFCSGDTNSLAGAVPAVAGGAKKWSSSMYNVWPACASVGVTNEEATGLWIFLTSGLHYSRYCDDSGSTSCPSTDDDRESADEVCSIPRLLFSSGEVMAYSKAVLDASA